MSERRRTVLGAGRPEDRIQEPGSEDTAGPIDFPRELEGGRADSPNLVDDGAQPGGVRDERAPWPSTRRLVAVVIVALLAAAAVVVHLLTGPGPAH